MGERGPKPRRKEVIWSPELAYAIGLMVTDGSLSRDGRHLDFTSKDKEQINNLRRCLGISAKCYKKKSGKSEETRKYYRVQWGDVTLYRFLTTIGLTPNKSLDLGVLRIPDKFFFDFLRGHFDGDGSFSSYLDLRWRNSFMYYLNFCSGSKNHIAWLREQLHAKLAVVGHVVNQKNSPVCQLRYAKRESITILGMMYPNSRVVSLSRKRLKISRTLRIVGDTQRGYVAQVL